jgi:dienelactone hydrolase
VQSGTLLAHREIPATLSGTRAWWVHYRSADLFGRPTESTAVVVAPDAPGGDRPVVTWCHGTTGLGDGSVPSAQAGCTGELITYPEPTDASQIDCGVPGMQTFLDAGCVVVATDYQGLGTPGFHHYTVHGTGARDAVHAVQAARALGDTGAGTRCAALGWSEGGGMAAGVAELPDDVLADLELRGVATYAPGFPGLVLQAGDAGLLDAAAALDPHILLMLAAHGWLFDELDPLDVLTPAALRLLDAEWNRLPCFTIGELALARSAHEGPMLRTDPQRIDVWIDCVLRGSAGTRAPSVPIWVATGSTDVTVPPQWQQYYLDALATFGADVTHVVDPEADHCMIPFTAQAEACAFLLGCLGA